MKKGCTREDPPPPLPTPFISEKLVLPLLPRWIAKSICIIRLKVCASLWRQIEWEAEKGVRGRRGERRKKRAKVRVEVGGETESGPVCSTKLLPRIPHFLPPFSSPPLRPSHPLSYPFRVCRAPHSPLVAHAERQRADPPVRPAFIVLSCVLRPSIEPERVREHAWRRKDGKHDIYRLWCFGSRSLYYSALNSTRALTILHPRDDGKMCGKMEKVIKKRSIKEGTWELNGDKKKSILLDWPCNYGECG